MPTIKRIILHNFKRFQDLDFEVNPTVNIFIGDNESGKSTILQAIDLVSRGSRTRVENCCLEKLFNTDSISDFMASDRNFDNIPTMYVELYFSERDDVLLYGNNNSLQEQESGIRLMCSYNESYSEQIYRVLQNSEESFPLEFFNIEFTTFAGEPFNAYAKKMRTLFIDNSNITNPYTMREYVQDIYHSQLSDIQRVKVKHEYRKNKELFQNNILAQYNEFIAPYCFGINESVDDNIETDINLMENNIPLQNKGTGKLCFIKTELSLNNKIEGIDSVLIEEPENHLSYNKMLQLINLISSAENRQLFITTHSDLISTRLNLRHCLLLSTSSQLVTPLSNLSEDTAKFFMKAPDSNMLKFVLSSKVILVEGDAEYILMEAFYHNVTGKSLSSSGIGIISVDGKCFTRYLEIAQLLKTKVAVITDNDHNFRQNISKKYADYLENTNILIRSDVNDERYTFEVCLYEDNKEICNTEFTSPNRRLSILDYMLGNKTEAAYHLLINHSDELTVPQYIAEAISWIDA